MSGHEAGSPVSVEFISTSLLYANWSLCDLHISIRQSQLGYTVFHVASCADEPRAEIDIFNSTFGSLKTEANANVSISHCFLDGERRQDSILMEIVTSTLTISDSEFLKNKAKNGPAILTAVSSDVRIQNSNYVHNFNGRGLIEVKNSSHLEMKNVLFQNHSEMHWNRLLGVAVVVVKWNSSARITGCQFINNKAVYGTGLFLYKSANVQVEDSVFVDNFAICGGAVNVNDGSLFSCTNCSFVENAAFYGGALYVESSSEMSVMIENSFFEGVLAFKGGAIFSWYTFGFHTTELKELHQIILGTKAELRTEIANAQQQSNTTSQSLDFESSCRKKIIWHIQASKFIILPGSNSDDVLSGGFCYFSCSDVEMKGCQFHNGTAVAGGSIAAFSGSQVTVTDTTFNSPEALLGNVLVANNNVDVTLVNCTIFNTSLYFDFTISHNCRVVLRDVRYHVLDVFPQVIFARNKCNLTLQNILFSVEEEAVYIGAFVDASGDVNVAIEDCTFHRKQGPILASDVVVIKISRSQIKGIRSLFYSARIDVSNGSSLHISHSNVSDLRQTFADQPFLRVFNNSQASMTNCLYKGNHLSRHIVVERNSSLTLNESAFASNFGGDEASLIEGSQSFISLRGTNFTDHFSDLVVLKSQSSSVLLERCTVSRNELNTHIIADNSNITILGSNFRDNFIDMFFAWHEIIMIMDISHGQLFIEGSHFVNNTFKGTYVEDPSYAFLFVERSNCTIKNSFFINNWTPDYFIRGNKQTETDPSNYISLEKVYVQQPGVSSFLGAHAFASIDVQDSLLSLPNNNLLMLFYNGHRVRVTSTNISCHDPKDLGATCLLFGADQELSVQLLTFKSIFTRNNNTIQSNQQNFLHQAEHFGIIGTEDSAQLTHCESVYASGKLNLVFRVGNSRILLLFER